MTRFKQFLARHKKLTVSFTMLCMTMFMSIACFAAEPAVTPVTVDVSEIMTNSVQTIVNNSLTMIAAVMPILITVFAVTLVIKFGIKFIQRIFNKA